MTEKLYTRVSPTFDAANPTGIVVASVYLEDTYGFTELGYDAVDYDVAPIVLEVTSLATKLADRGDVEAAAERAGIKVWMDLDQFLAEWPNATPDGFAERMYPAIEDSEPNQLLARPEVQRELEAAGFDGFHDYVVVSNTQPSMYAFWKAGTYSVGEPVALVTPDPEDPYHVELADTVSSITP